MKIKSINFIGENRPKNRKIKIKLDTGSLIIIESCFESWQQYGGTNEELFFTMPIAEKFNNWLHGGDMNFNNKIYAMEF